MNTNFISSTIQSFPFNKIVTLIYYVNINLQFSIKIVCDNNWVDASWQIACKWVKSKGDLLNFPKMRNRKRLIRSVFKLIAFCIRFSDEISTEHLKQNTKKTPTDKFVYVNFSCRIHNTPFDDDKMSKAQSNVWISYRKEKNCVYVRFGFHHPTVVLIS